MNAFQAAGGVAFVTRELVEAGNLHPDVTTIMGQGLEAYFKEPRLEDGELVWRDTVREPGPDHPAARLGPVRPRGGLRLVQGDLGRAVIKISAVKPENRIVEAPAAVFETQEDALQAFKDGKLDRDVVVVLRFQGPRANGMPELHSLSPALSVLQDKGFRVAFVTDGRMSGASGKTPAAIHVSPEALAGGPLAHVRDGDVIRLDPEAGVLTTLGAGDLKARPAAARSRVHAEGSSWGYGRELFGAFRQAVSTAEQGASVCFSAPSAPTATTTARPIRTWSIARWTHDAGKHDLCPASGRRRRRHQRPVRPGPHRRGPHGAGAFRQLSRPDLSDLSGGVAAYLDRCEFGPAAG